VVRRSVRKQGGIPRVEQLAARLKKRGEILFIAHEKGGGGGHACGVIFEKKQERGIKENPVPGEESFRKRGLSGKKTKGKGKAE